INDTLVVVSPIAGGPSDQLGVMSGDRIVEIDGQTAIGIKTEDVLKRLRGDKGSKVAVRIERPGEKALLSFTIVRDKIPTFSVDLAIMLSDKVGYIKISKFVQTTHEEFLAAADDLKKQGMKQLVLDLRGNPGGLLDQAIKIADEFLDSGKIVYTKSRNKAMDQTDFAKPGDTFEKNSVIVLVDKGSASASEIVSGALQDQDRAIIVGETTFGKGLVQRQFEFTDGSAMRVTVSRYYTPLGRQIQRSFKEGKEGREAYYSEAYHRGELDGLVKQGKNGQNPDSLLARNHILETAIFIKPDSLHPAYKTPSGRTLLGGGGIMPDYIIEPDTVTIYSRQLRSKRVLEEVAMQYVTEHNGTLKAAYKENMARFRNEFAIDPNLIKKVIELGKSKGVPFNQNAYQKDEAYLKSVMKSKIARQIWGFKGEIAIMTGQDNVLNQALGLFQKADALAKIEPVK
ncbi:MAG: S41 family peptidase, partial [Chlorobiales bacterium]|nr:S41 family peptidase [Chlorobiales bacterium]